MCRCGEGVVEARSSKHERHVDISPSILEKISAGFKKSE